VIAKNVMILIFGEIIVMSMSWLRGLVISSLPANEKTGAMGREIESRRGIQWYFLGINSQLFSRCAAVVE
jgi:hypothetical protein